MDHAHRISCKSKIIVFHCTTLSWRIMLFKYASQLSLLSLMMHTYEYLIIWNLIHMIKKIWFIGRIRCLLPTIFWRKCFPFACISDLQHFYLYCFKCCCFDYFYHNGLYLIWSTEPVNPDIENHHSFLCSAPASSWRGVCFTATSIESNTRAIEFLATRAATTGHSAPTDTSARSDAALITDRNTQLKNAAIYFWTVDHLAN